MLRHPPHSRAVKVFAIGMLFVCVLVLMSPLILIAIGITRAVLR